MILFGKAKLGKTTALMNLATYMMLAGYRVHYYTLEMAPDYLILRSLSCCSDIPTFDLTNSNIVSDIKRRMDKQFPDHGTIVFYEYPSGKLTPSMISQNLSGTASDGKMTDVVIVDYVDLMALPNETRNEWSGISRNTQSLRGIALENDVVMITASQFGKAGLDKQELGGSDTYGSVAKIFMADVVGFLNEQEEQSKTKTGKVITRHKISFTLGYARYGKGGVKIILDSNREMGRIFPMPEWLGSKKNGV